MQTSNPVLRRFETVAETSDKVMTLNGTIGKCVLSLAILFLGAFWSWRVIPAAASSGWIIAGAIGTLVLALITAFNPKAAPVTTPLYAGAEGLLLGTISAYFDARYPGVAMQAVCLTALTTFIMLVAYRTGLIKATEKFRSFIIIATLSVMGIYLIDFILSLFGRGIPLSTSTGTFGLLFSAVVVCIAALNLILDFALIDEGSKNNLPKYMEWYGAFALMVTVVWLYMEILRLLVKLQSRRN